jgi:hypothetical protein
MNKIIIFLSVLGTAILLNANQSKEYKLMSLEELMHIKITGSTKSEKSIHDIPAAVTLFTSDEIEC